MRHSSGGVSSRTVPLSMRPEIARSRVDLVAKGQTRALFLLIAIFGAALEKGLLGEHVAGVREELAVGI